MVGRHWQGAARAILDHSTKLNTVLAWSIDLDNKPFSKTILTGALQVAFADQAGVGGCAGHASSVQARHHAFIVRFRVDLRPHRKHRLLPMEPFQAGKHPLCNTPAGGSNSGPAASTTDSSCFCPTRLWPQQQLQLHNATACVCAAAAPRQCNTVSLAHGLPTAMPCSGILAAAPAALALASRIALASSGTVWPVEREAAGTLRFPALPLLALPVCHCLWAAGADWHRQHPATARPCSQHLHSPGQPGTAATSGRQGTWRRRPGAPPAWRRCCSRHPGCPRRQLP